MRQLLEPDQLAEEKRRQAERSFLNSLSKKQTPRMETTETKPTPIEAVIEPAKPTSPINFGEVAGLLGVGVRELCEWAERGLLPLPQEKTTHPHHWRWDRDAMTRWIDSMKAGLAKAMKSRL